ncbi:Alanine--tRNA ligase, cytoplasmic [Toxocara canis]|uniref:Alanine--tRNA ligase, cytoplasmic n=1 Tax=Toxocara canis TaxID=6265 RepID=A0A0B2URD9_TOXCA|nr:Alanine--tRNA ligase, cytoplasmic [Toxocara canis]
MESIWPIVWWQIISAHSVLLYPMEADPTAPAEGSCLSQPYIISDSPDRYVLRRILRRGVRYANEKLGAPPGFFASLVPVIVGLLGETFPELKKDPETVIDIINDEEAQFLKTLNRGRALFQKAVAALEPNVNQFPGDVAWRLYDTYGFPVDLTQLMAEEKGLSVDTEAFERCRQRAVELSYAGANKFRDTAELDVHAIANLKNKGVPKTDDSPKYDYSATGPNDITAKYSSLLIPFLYS